MSELRALSIVIPSYNGRPLLRRTLRALEHAAPGAEIVVVDGESADGSPQMVREEFPHVKLVPHRNHGFAHATNRGIEQASRPYLLLMNSDLFVTRDAVQAMLTRLAANPRLGAVAPRLANEDGTRQEVFGAFYWPNWIEVTKASEVWLLHGACLMTRRDVVERVGALDETFFLYNEEYDWCARARQAGFHLEVIPEQVVHVGGGSTGRNPLMRLEEQRGFMYLTAKHGSPLVSEGLRRLMQFEGYCFSRVDPRPEHREMWAKLESLSRRGAFRESHFEVSGRGDSVAQPQGLKLKDPVEPGASGGPVLVVEQAAQSASESGPHSIPTADQAPDNVRPIRREGLRRANRAAM